MLLSFQSNGSLYISTGRICKTPESNSCIIDIYFLSLKAENFPRRKLGDFSERFGFAVYAVNRKPVLLISCFSTVTFKTCQDDTINLEKGICNVKHRLHRSPSLLCSTGSERSNDKA